VTFPDLLESPPGWRLADLLPGFGYSRCYRCHRPWWLRWPPREVPTAPDGHSGSFTLCRPCWGRATTTERLAAHRWLIDQRIRMGTPVAEAEQVWAFVAAHIEAQDDG
jgi:hypothetical protein